MIAFRLHPGSDLRKSLEEIVYEHGISAGYVASAVGSLERISLRLAGAKKSLDQLCDYEIVSLQGTLGESGCHIHMSVADESGAVVGGHLQYGCIIRTTCEVVIVHDPDVLFHRTIDEATGFKELEVRSRQ